MLFIHYNDADDIQKIVDDNRRIDQKHDFLLAPLGFTHITQVGEKFLILVSKSKKLKKNNNKTKKSTVFLEITLLFNSRAEREEWMKIIIAECQKVYLKKFIDMNNNGANFVTANAEIWSAILLGDEALRNAYIAPAESDQFKVVQYLVNIVVQWVKILVGSELLMKSHNAIFVSLFSLALQDTVARALLILWRPSREFLKDYKDDTAAGTNPCDDSVDNAFQLIEREKRVVALSFIEYVKMSVRDVRWEQFRKFLALVDHPSFQPRFSQSLMHAVFISNNISSWTLFKNSMMYTPCPSCFENPIINQVLEVQKLLPPAVFSMSFNSSQGSFSTPLNLYDDFKQRWELFHEDHATRDAFFDAVCMDIWLRITLNNDPGLCKLFISTVPSTTGIVSFIDVLHTIGFAAASVERDRSMATYRSFSSHRLLSWVHRIVCRTELTSQDAPIYVDLLVAAAKDGIVRAILWHMLPVRDSLQQRVTGMDGRSFSLKFIDTLLKLSDSNNWIASFLPFLIICKHPLVRDHFSNQTPHSAFTFSFNIGWPIECRLASIALGC